MSSPDDKSASPRFEISLSPLPPLFAKAALDTALTPAAHYTRGRPARSALAIPRARNCTNEFRNGGESPWNALNCNEGKISGSAGTVQQLSMAAAAAAAALVA